MGQHEWVASSRAGSTTLPTTRHQHLTVTRGSRLFGNNIGTFSYNNESSPFTAGRRQGNACQRTHDRHGVVGNCFFNNDRTSSLLPSCIASGAFCLLFVLCPLLSLHGIVCTSLGFSGAFCLLTRFARSELFSAEDHFVATGATPGIAL